MNITIILLVVVVLIIVICLYVKYCETNKLKETLTLKVSNRKYPSTSYSPNIFPQAYGSMTHLDYNNTCGEKILREHHCEHHREHHPHHREMEYVDNECHKSMMGMFGNMFKSLPSVDKLPHITHTLQITPKKTQSVSTAASIAASQHGSSIAPAQSSPASVPSSTSPSASPSAASAPSSAASAPVTKSSSATTNKNKCISSGWVSSSLENIDKSSSYKPTKCPTNYLFNYSNPNVQYVYDTTNKCPGNVSIYDKNKTFLGCACIPGSDCLNNLSSTPASTPPSAPLTAPPSTPASVPPSAPSSAPSAPPSAAPVTKSSSATTNKKKCISSGWVSSSLENVDKSSSYKPTKCPTNYLFNYSNPNVQYVYDTTNKCPGNVSIYDKNKTFLGCACIPGSDCE